MRAFEVPLAEGKSNGSSMAQVRVCMLGEGGCVRVCMFWGQDHVGGVQVHACVHVEGGQECVCVCVCMVV